MISLSSIVKANLLTTVPPLAEQSKEPSEISRAEIEQINIEDVNEKKETILRQAITKAKHIESEASLRSESLINSAMKSSREIMNTAEKRGYDEGYLRGLVDGANASERAAEEGLGELRRLLDAMKAERISALEREESDMIKLAFELAKKIMKQHMQVDENAVQKMLEELIVENEGSVKIYMSEYQKSLDVHVDKALAKKLKAISKDAKIVIIKDEDLIMGETESGIIDMSVPVQLENLKKAVDHAS